jgi:fluoride ion exporter CrcB/FEX
MVLNQFLYDIERHYEFNSSLSAGFSTFASFNKELMNNLEISEYIKLLILYDEVEELT